MSTIRDPLSRKCDTLEKPGDYCGIPRLGKPATAKEKQCVRFYQAALDSAHIQCSYQEELDHLHRAGELSRTDYIADRIKQIHIKYGDKALALTDELEDSYRESQQWTDEQELTYHNVAWSLRAFHSRIRLTNPRSARKPASTLSEESLGRMPTESTPDLMKRLIIPVGPAR